MTGDADHAGRYRAGDGSGGGNQGILVGISWMFFQSNDGTHERDKDHGRKGYTQPVHGVGVAAFVQEYLTDHADGVRETKEHAVGANGQDHAAQTRQLGHLERRQ